MSRKPNLGFAKCPRCGRAVPVTGLRKLLAHWEGVGLRCPASGQVAPYIAASLKEAQK